MAYLALGGDGGDLSAVGAVEGHDAGELFALGASDGADGAAGGAAALIAGVGGRGLVSLGDVADLALLEQLGPLGGGELEGVAVVPADVGDGRFGGVELLILGRAAESEERGQAEDCDHCTDLDDRPGAAGLAARLIW